MIDVTERVEFVFIARVFSAWLAAPGLPIQDNFSDASFPSTVYGLIRPAAASAANCLVHLNANLQVITVLVMTIPAPVKL